MARFLFLCRERGARSVEHGAWGGEWRAGSG
jgi:hypothetical protein